LRVPNAPAGSSSVRRTQFIGAAVAGVSLQFFLHSDTAHTTPIGSGTFDVSATSGLCTPATGVRMCSLQQTTQVGTEDLVVTSYDAPPASGSFAGAHQLGIGTIYNVALTAGSNTLAVAIGGTVATLSVSPAIVSLPGGSAANFPLVYTAFDKSSEMIVAGANTVTNGAGNTETDTYSNPITFSVSEIGGSGHVLLSTGGAPATSVVVTTSNTTVEVLYDGGGSTGYSAAIAATSIGATSAYAALGIQFGAGIFVANSNGPSIETFPYISSFCTTLAPCTLNEAPLATIATPAVPTGVALDSSNRIYVSNYFPGNLVSVYASNANGGATAIETIAFGALAYPEFIAVDSLGRIYVDVYNQGYVNVYAPVSAACTAASPCINPPRIATFEALAPPPFFNPFGIALDSSDRLYAIDHVTGVFSVFAPLSASCTTLAPCTIPYTSVVASLSMGVSYGSTAVDPSGRVYLTVSGAIQVFAPVPLSCSVGAPCSFSQVATINGTFGQLSIDPSGNLYSSTGATNSVTVYPPVSMSCTTTSPCSITASPVATISGALTGLDINQGVAVP
jgi:hypothetical protein